MVHAVYAYLLQNKEQIARTQALVVKRDFAWENRESKLDNEQI